MYLKRKWNKYYYNRKNKVHIKKRIESAEDYCHDNRFRPRLHKLFSLMQLKKGLYRYKHLFYKENLLLLGKLHRRIFFYLGPFFVNRVFFSKLIRLRVLKRLSTIW
jgi:hypothetical protein